MTQNMYAYQKTNRYFCQTAEGLEELAAAELEELGATEVNPVFRGLFFSAEPAELYGIVYRARLASRLLAPLISFDCHSPKYLHKTAGSLDWSDFMNLDTTFAVSAGVAESAINHSQYAALCLKDAIVDQFRDRTGERPSVDVRNPEVQFHLYIHKNVATIYLDLGSGSLHRRGYRVETVEAPMQELLAAAIVRLSEWDGERCIYDPMCGSGTILCEALMSHCRIPAGYLRQRFGFERLPDFDPKVWRAVKQAADSAIRPLQKGLIAGSDIDPQAIAATKTNLKRLPGGENVELKACGFQQLPGLNDCTIATNPPYGLRLGHQDQIGAFITEFGDFMKQRCKGSTAYVYLGKRELLKQVGLRSKWKKPLMNGQLDGRLARFDLY